MNRLALGGLAGFVATLAMSVPIVGGRALRLLWTPPPAEITAKAEARTGLADDLPATGFRARWLAAHVGYGMACGAIYTLARPLLPSSTVAAGLAFGGAVWGVSYLGLMPALGLYPWPADDSRSRTVVLIVAHAVFGVSLAETERLLGHVDGNGQGELVGFVTR